LKMSQTICLAMACVSSMQSSGMGEMLWDEPGDLADISIEDMVGDVVFLCWSGQFYGGQPVVSMVGSDEVGGMHVLWAYPFVIAIREALPFDQILQFLGPSSLSMGENPLYLLFFFSINNIWRRTGEVGAMCFGLMVWEKKGCMEHIVYLPCHWECQPVDNWGYHPCDIKGTILLWVQLGCLVWQL
jgi:hypothetical protein